MRVLLKRVFAILHRCPPWRAVLVALVLAGTHLYAQGPSDSLSIRISKAEYKLHLFRGSEKVKSYEIAVGKNAGDKQRRGDNRTPEGKFVVSQVQSSRHWEHDFGDGKGAIRGAYGPWFIRLDTGSNRTRSGKAWTGIGIHGTHDPGSIGTMATEGCVRMKNEELEELKSLVRIGIAVTIEP